MPGEEPSLSPLVLGIYPRAHILNRMIARLVDGLLVAAVAKLAPPVGWLGGLTYLLIADGFSGGRSVGKRLIGLQTISPRSRDASGFRESILRNLPLGLAYILYSIPYVGWLLACGVIAFEALLILGNDQGLRLGDEIAHTQVLDAGTVDLPD